MNALKKLNLVEFKLSGESGISDLDPDPIPGLNFCNIFQMKFFRNFKQFKTRNFLQFFLFFCGSFCQELDHDPQTHTNSNPDPKQSKILIDTKFNWLFLKNVDYS